MPLKPLRKIQKIMMPFYRWEKRMGKRRGTSKFTKLK